MSENQNTILPGELKNLMDDGDIDLLLDVRSTEEFELAKIEGSILIPLNELDGRFDEIGGFKEKLIITICHHGVRSRMAAESLTQAGFENVKSLTGGIDAWAVEIDSSVLRY